MQTVALNRQFPSYLLPLYQDESTQVPTYHSCENVFGLHKTDELASKTLFHMKGFAHARTHFEAEVKMDSEMVYLLYTLYTRI